MPLAPNFFWAVPSWNGDFRLIADGDQAVLTAEKPTPAEQKILDEFLKLARKKKWIDYAGERLVKDGDRIILDTTAAKAGKALVAIARPRKAVLTAVSFVDGKVEVAEVSESKEHDKLVAKMESEPASEDASAATTTPAATAAATVSRPTPCCPACEPGEIAPAGEVLRAFLTPEQHEDWARSRAIVAVGGYTGARYLLAHRHSRAAQKIGRVCFDLDAQQVVHFYDWSVPPEEEVLAAKLILEHREDWLRNEATMLDGGGAVGRFKNPFGGFLDGTETSSFMASVGRVAMVWTGGERTRTAS